jgi:hypothetical protein
MPVGLAGAAETVKIEMKGTGIHGYRRHQMSGGHGKSEDTPRRRPSFPSLKLCQIRSTYMINELFMPNWECHAYEGALRVQPGCIIVLQYSSRNTEYSCFYHR